MYQAQYYHSGSVASSAAICEITDDVLIVKVGHDDEHLTLARSDVKVKSKLGDLPREIVLPNGDMLVCPSTDPLDNWLDGPSGATIFRIESKTSWLIGSVILVPLLLYVVFAHVIPQVAISLAAYVPYSVKQIASDQTLSALDYSVLDVSTLSEQEIQSMQNSFNELLEQISTKNPRYRVMFRASESFGPNAFALPDGTIVFTDELVNLVDKEQALLDAIFLHEVGHVENNHSMQLVAESLFATLAIIYFFGDLSGALESFLGVGSSVVHNQFSQAHEWESDNYAIAQLRVLNRDPADFADAMRVLQSLVGNEHEANSWFQSHPMIQNRIDNANRASEESRNP